jgi:hypothetical protein
MSIIKRKPAPPPPMRDKKSTSMLAEEEDDGETTGGESAGSSVAYGSSRVSKQKKQQLNSASELPSPRGAGEDGWISPYAFPVLNAGGSGGGSSRKNERAGKESKKNRRDKKNVKWNDGEMEEEREEDVGSSRNLKAMLPKKTKADSSPVKSESTSYPTMPPPSGGGEGGESVSPAKYITYATPPPASSSDQRTLPKTPPPRRPPRNLSPPSAQSAGVGDLYSGTTMSTSALASTGAPTYVTTDQEDESGEGFAVFEPVTDKNSLRQADGMSDRQATDLTRHATRRPGAPADRSLAPQRPPRKPATGSMDSGLYAVQ